MEASALRHAPRVPVLAGLSPHLRLQSDERLVALVRRGHQGAFEVLLKRYQPRLLAFCRHMLGSNEDAEDVLQEVFASAYRAMCADDRPIAARPWLYRIARNRCLNHMRRPRDAGQDSMDLFEREAGATAADTVHRREEFRQIIADVHELPHSQRTALLLREIDTLSYDQIAEAMDTTVPSVKSLLVRARMSLAEASEARQLTCAEVRLQLTQAAEGLARPAATTRRHVRSCPRCRSFKRELRRTSQALAAVSPAGPAAAAMGLLGGGTAGAGKGAAGGSTVAGGGAAVAGGGAGLLSAAGGSIFAKAAAGIVTAALVTAGAAEVRGGDADQDRGSSASTATVAPTDERLRPTPPLMTGGPAASGGAPAGRAEPAASHRRPMKPEATAAPQVPQPTLAEPSPAPLAEAPPPATEGDVPPPPAPTGEAPTAQGDPGSAPSDEEGGTSGSGFPGVEGPSGSGGGAGGDPTASGNGGTTTHGTPPPSAPGSGGTTAGAAGG